MYMYVICMCIYICMYVCIYAYVCMYVCMYVCTRVYVCMYVCMYVHVDLFLQSRLAILKANLRKSPIAQVINSIHIIVR